MNTSALKRFAQQARRKLLEQVAAKLEQVLHTDSAELREKAGALRKLQEEINHSSKEQVIDKAAYTWFNRLMALRFMDANDYQPLGVRVITPKDGYTLPEILDEAKQGQIPDELPVKPQHIYDLLDGKIPSTNAQNEAYKELLIGACNHLNKVFPFLFERINDYAELLLPDDLTSEFSIVQDMREGMTNDDCQKVEIIGWLYQFYISEKKDELINAKKKYKADEIAPVTQLFTPKWIVQYMVDNTLGQFWKEARPNTKVNSELKFYIKPHNPELIPTRNIKSPEEINFFDPCVGSAHVLCYAFDLFYRIYEEEGYNPTEIPELIISKNLHGIDIDERASQLAGFALMMKGRQYHRRFLKKQVIPNITSFQDFESHPKFENAKVLGSLIKITKDEVDAIEVDKTSLFGARNEQLKTQASLLAEKYDIVVTNPPYLNSSYMEGTLKQFVAKEYKETKSDLFACFLTQAANLTKKNGFIGFISPYVWMFISSYEKLRQQVLGNSTITSLIQLEYNAFEPACVPIATFTLKNEYLSSCKGSYIKLSDFKGHETQAPKTLEAIQDHACGWFFTANQKDFEQIPGRPIGYWISQAMLCAFEKNSSLRKFAAPKQGISTTNNDLFLRRWHEVAFNTSTVSVGDKWFPYNKGGAFRRWYGNLYYVLNWQNDGEDAHNYLNLPKSFKGAPLRGKDWMFKEGFSWSSLSSGKVAFRYCKEGFAFDAKGPMLFPINSQFNNYILGLVNSIVALEVLKILAPTLDFNQGPIGKIPFKYQANENVDSLVSECTWISKHEWDSKEGSWNFKQNELIRIKGQDLEESFDLYREYWKLKYHKLHDNEVQLNSHFIDIYGFEEELIPDVPMEDITILHEETSIIRNDLAFNGKVIFVQFISYAVGCMLGRYSLDREGLILANQGETLEDYLQKTGPAVNTGTHFLPDEDNIIPILDDEWFEDDITGRFYDFLRITFGKENFEKNLTFVEDALGKDIRKYFVKDFYPDHIKRYKKRPIYWMFSSPRGSFNVLIYLHRYTPDTLNQILNGYLKEYREKLNSQMEQLDHLVETGSSSEQTKAAKEIDKLRLILLELQEYERDTLYPLASKRISIDLDDGVLVNYNKFGNAIKPVAGLNDAKTKKKVRGFDWIDTSTII